MRGSPLVRALLAFLAILSLGYPLLKLTGGSAPENVAATTQTPPNVGQVVLQVTFTTPPLSFVVKQLGKAIWEETGGGVSAERSLHVTYPAEGVDLQFAAKFPEGAPLAAARLRLTDPAGETHEKSVWGSGTIEEVVTFP